LNAEVVRRWYEIAGGGDLDALHEILATDTVDHVSGQTGVEWWKRILGAARACIDAEPGELDDLICSGDRVVARFTVRGRYRAATLPMLQGTEPAGQSVEWEHVHLFRLVEGRIAEHWAVRDDLGLLRQISGDEALDGPPPGGGATPSPST